MSQEKKKRLGIIVGGGPAPGINGVISAAGLEALDQGIEVVGLYDGFESLCTPEPIDMNAPRSFARLLDYKSLTHIHGQSGTILRTSRKRPSEDELKICIKNIEDLNIGYLMTIGGDDTLGSSRRLAKASGGVLRVVHVPKTIDNDLPLPANSPTFGYESARHHGVEIVTSLLFDAKATKRWFFGIMMGRTAGHLALGVAKAAGATCVIIPEDFGDNEITLDNIVDILIGTMLKRHMPPRTREDGVAIIAEGVATKLKKSELEAMEKQNLAKIGYDTFGHIKLADIQLGRALNERLHERLGKDLAFEGGMPLTQGIVVKDIGYELRCCDPIPFDIQYTRDLGYSAAKLLLTEGKSGYLMALRNGSSAPIKYEDLEMAGENKIKPRLIDIHSESYEVARKYMFRLSQEDLDDPETLKGLTASSGKLDGEQLKEFFKPSLAVQVKPGKAGVSS